MNCAIDGTLTVSTGARLHCGLFSDHRPGGRLFQGFGFMIDRPGFRLSLQQTAADRNEIIFEEPSARQSYQSRIERIISDCLRHWNRPNNGFRLTVHEHIPPHVGLGSGTQLALAIARLVATSFGEKTSIEELASATRRAKRSTVGTYGFDQGGLLIDSGVRHADELGRCRFRTAIPDEWRFVLVTPPHVVGFSGDQEVAAFDRLPEIDAKKVAELEADLKEIENHASELDVLSKAIQRYGNRIGDTFLPVQGGRFRDPVCEAIVSQFVNLGVQGVAQTSWGPTILGLCGNQAQADGVRDAFIETDLNATIIIARPMNHGAQISCPASSEPHV